MKVTQVDYKGDGTSLWGNSKGVFTVDRVEVGYVNWVSWPKDKKDKLHASVNMYGPTTRCEQYTDRAIEKAIGNDVEMIAAIRSQIQAKLDEAGIKRKVPAKLGISWSEYGMQPENGWNFDVGSR